MLKTFLLSILFTASAFADLKPFPRPIPKLPILPPIIAPADLGFYVTTGGGTTILVSDMNGSGIFPLAGNQPSAHLALNPVNQNLYAQIPGGNLSAMAPLSAEGWSQVDGFTGATDVTFDSSGVAYGAVCSNGNNIFRINLITRQYETLGGFSCPEHIRVAKNGKIFVASRGRLWIMDDITGRNMITIDDLGPYNLRYADITGIDLDSKGRLYVLLRAQNKVVRINDPATRSYETLQASSIQAFDLALDKHDRIYLTFPLSREISRFDDLKGANNKRFFMPAKVGDRTIHSVVRLVLLPKANLNRPR